MDDIDRALIRELQQNADRTNVELARVVGLSPAATLHRIRRLKDSGVILGIHARVDPAAAGLPLQVHVEVTLGGEKLAESDRPVLLDETGLPTRYYLNRTEIDFSRLEPSATQTACPYKGQTTGYWSVRSGDQLHEDLAWAYDFPTRQLAPIAGLIAFYNEKGDTFIDGVQLERPETHSS